MTQKELLYLEDAVSHEDILINVLNDTYENLENEEFKTFIDEQISIHEDAKEKLMNILEVKSNE